MVNFFSFKVTALARFGAICEDLLPNILVLLNRCQLDTDDEVRDRAIFFKSILEQQKSTLNAAQATSVSFREKIYFMQFIECSARLCWPQVWSGKWLTTTGRTSSICSRYCANKYFVISYFILGIHLYSRYLLFFYFIQCDITVTSHVM